MNTKDPALIVVAPVPPDPVVETVKVPLPFLVKAKLPTNCEIVTSLSTVVVVSAYKVAVPKLSEPLLLVSPMVTVPPLVKTKLFVNVLAVVLLAETFAPPLIIRFPVPNASSSPISIVPADKVVLPEYVLAFVNVNDPAPDLMMLLVPVVSVITPA